MAFSKLKALLRGTGARTFDQLLQTLGEICDLFTPDECWNYFRHAGYVPTKMQDALARVERQSADAEDTIESVQAARRGVRSGSNPAARSSSTMIKSCVAVAIST
jgi:hypothetical protein